MQLPLFAARSTLYRVRVLPTRPHNGAANSINKFKWIIIIIIERIISWTWELGKLVENNSLVRFAILSMRDAYHIVWWHLWWKKFNAILNIEFFRFDKFMIIFTRLESISIH